MTAIHQHAQYAMPNPLDRPLLEAVLDSWDRNNAILLNFLRALPERGLEARALEDSPSIAELFTHIHYVRLAFVSKDAPEVASNVPEHGRADERDPMRIAEMLTESAAAVREAVRRRVEAGRGMDLHYDHPILLLQHMLWHEGYHHGQMKLALKAAGNPMSDEVAGPITWGVWIDKS
ncbi:MAG TPA: DinB family protein [Longimicrobiales bacterium]